MSALLLCLLCWAEASAQSSAPVEAIATAPVTLDGERLFAVRGTSAVPAEERAQVIRERLLAAARDPAFDPADLALEPIDGGVAIRTADHLLLGVYEADAEVEGVDTRVLAASMMSRLSRAVLDYRAARGPEGVRDAMRLVGIETLVLAGALLAIFLLERLSGRLIHRYVDGRVAAWEARAHDVVRLQGLWRSIRRGVRLAFFAAAVLAVFAWLNAVLLALPWTRDAGRAVTGAVSDPLWRVGRSIILAVPDLVTLGLIAALAVFALRLSGRFFTAVETGRLRFRTFEPEWATPTARIARLAILALAVVMAYPYIPGSSSEAFKAISILFGIMLSLGATSIVANVIAGQSLVYRGAFRVGDRIEVTGVVGDVEEMRSQVTFLRTPKNERVILPNSVLLGSQVTNYSCFARDGALILHTEVGIGYEVPWRSVEAMLLEAARRTPKLLSVPPAFVLQKRLGDFSPVYELNAFTDDAAEMYRTYSAMHASIQDVFAERGIQIMTPSYVADPAEAKVPPSSDTGRLETQSERHDKTPERIIVDEDLQR